MACCCFSTSAFSCVYSDEDTGGLVGGAELGSEGEKGVGLGDTTAGGGGDLADTGGGGDRAEVGGGGDLVEAGVGGD